MVSQDFDVEGRARFLGGEDRHVGVDVNRFAGDFDDDVPLLDARELGRASRGNPVDLDPLAREVIIGMPIFGPFGPPPLNVFFISTNSGRFGIVRKSSMMRLE